MSDIYRRVLRKPSELCVSYSGKRIGNEYIEIMTESIEDNESSWRSCENERRTGMRPRGREERGENVTTNTKLE